MAPPATSKALGLLWREAAIGTGLGIVAAFIWKFSVSNPTEKGIKKFYLKSESESK
eukprot:CAMPEP_0117753356 /NCGR_PEP_ID=MMETSP0947-20121206/12172_1 /TAXON_ID=44440 /ORGANISM="Chattonella subsalsa, Strain CCMP2191" /LENGTH=55 /DNA_ID=CAMNT_0005572213 /DNA_START=90 /DNA_END=257 /DNA_ORIENTATION=-